MGDVKTVTVLMLVRYLMIVKSPRTIQDICSYFSIDNRTAKRYLKDIREAGWPLVDERTAANQKGLYRIRVKDI